MPKLTLEQRRYAVEQFFETKIFSEAYRRLRSKYPGVNASNMTWCVTYQLENCY